MSAAPASYQTTQAGVVVLCKSSLPHNIRPGKYATTDILIHSPDMTAQFFIGPTKKKTNVRTLSTMPVSGTVMWFCFANPRGYKDAPYNNSNMYVLPTIVRVTYLCTEIELTLFTNESEEQRQRLYAAFFRHYFSQRELEIASFVVHRYPLTQEEDDNENAALLAFYLWQAAYKNYIPSDVSILGGLLMNVLTEITFNNAFFTTVHSTAAEEPANTVPTDYDKHSEQLHDLAFRVSKLLY
jgi:hypothetical protein